MQVFINECSIHEQFYEYGRFELSLRRFFSVLTALNRIQAEAQLYQIGDILIYKAVRAEILAASLNRIRDKSLKSAINNIFFNKLNAQDWMAERIHSSDDLFVCDGELVTDTSMAEIAERIQCSITELGLLINFPESKFEGRTSVVIDKNEEVSTSVDCISQRGEFEKWLELNFALSKYEYGFDSNMPPRDTQTILIEISRFIRTTLPKQGGRTIYREIQTQFLWYVDNLHFGNAAHFEVFDSNGNHIGEADLDGILNGMKADNQKKLGF